MRAQGRDGGGGAAGPNDGQSGHRGHSKGRGAVGSGGVGGGRGGSAKAEGRATEQRRGRSSARDPKGPHTPRTCSPGPGSGPGTRPNVLCRGGVRNMERPPPVFEDRPCKERGSVASQAHTTENVSNIRRSSPERVGEARIPETGAKGPLEKGPCPRRGGRGRPAGPSGCRGQRPRGRPRTCRREQGACGHLPRAQQTGGPQQERSQLSAGRTASHAARPGAGLRLREGRSLGP